MGDDPARARTRATEAEVRGTNERQAVRVRDVGRRETTRTGAAGPLGGGAVGNTIADKQLAAAVRQG